MYYSFKVALLFEIRIRNWFDGGALFPFLVNLLWFSQSAPIFLFIFNATKIMFDCDNICCLYKAWQSDDYI